MVVVLVGELLLLLFDFFPFFGEFVELDGEGVLAVTLESERPTLE